MVRDRVLVFFVLIGVLIGAVAGYAVATVQAVSSLSFMELNRPPRADFDNTVDGFSRLGAYESNAANCSEGSDVQLAVTKESEVIHHLQQSKAIDSSLLNLAQAVSLVRKMVTAEKNGHTEEQRNTASEVEKLLRDAGWTNPSAEHFQEIIREVDQDQCRHMVVEGRQ